MDGFNLHQLHNGTFLRAFRTGTPIKGVPKQVAFGEDTGVIVGGSDHGVVYIFDRKTGSILDVLAHVDDELVQTVTV